MLMRSRATKLGILEKELRSRASKLGILEKELRPRASRFKRFPLELALASTSMLQISWSLICRATFGEKRARAASQRSDHNLGPGEGDLAKKARRCLNALFLSHVLNISKSPTQKGIENPWPCQSLTAPLQSYFFF